MVIDANYIYTLPFPINKKYKIIQSFGDRFSHNLEHSKYALDIGTQIGDTITAARKGKVFYIKGDSKEHCRTRKCMNKANKILVIHDDGTIANYVHLDFNGVLVNVGDEIEVNQPIGISGMTGFTTTPHLHFVVHKYGGISIPFYFKGFEGKKLKKGKYYRRKL
ncbi:M23 family metallopeptidase [Winogradskyella ursingii]|uniref:M23 family metallopeptidase n=1 Tax=Winogradskyella ursingii TaxID=2686079 RepID=UPI0015CD11D0|nr:M23 family metallopeptidase [Winogradskyella ursingii]